MSSAQRVLKQFLPTKLEILLLILANGAMLLAVLYSLSVSRNANVSEFDSFTKVYFFGRAFTWIRDVVGSIISANVATMILWGVIGSFVYSFITGIQSFFSDAALTLQSTFLYVHPKGLSKAHFVLEVLVERLISIIIVFTMIVYVWAFCASILPLVYSGAEESILPLSSDSFYAAGYFVFLSVALHGLIILFRLENGRYKADSI